MSDIAFKHIDFNCLYIILRIIIIELALSFKILSFNWSLSGYPIWTQSASLGVRFYALLVDFHIFCFQSVRFAYSRFIPIVPSHCQRAPFDQQSFRFTIWSLLPLPARIVQQLRSLGLGWVVLKEPFRPPVSCR